MIDIVHQNKALIESFSKLAYAALTENFPGQIRTAIFDDQDIHDTIKPFVYKQRHNLLFLYDWDESLIKCKSIKQTCQQHQFHLFLSGNWGRGKLHLIKTISYALCKLLLY